MKAIETHHCVRALRSILATFFVSAIGYGQELQPTPDQVQSCLSRGVTFLLKDQNPDGSWGSHRNALPGFDDAFMNAPSQRAFTIGTTGLGCIAMASIPPTTESKAAYEKSIDYLIANAADAKRISEWDCDNTWAYVYGLQALVQAHAAAEGARREKIASAIRDLLARFKQYQTPLGGWGYYDAGDTTTFPPNWATSFMTSAAILALLDAQTAGFEPDREMLERAVRAIRRCRLPTGAYTYSLDLISIPRHGEGINNIKGSLGRIQVCNLALKRAAAAGYKAGADITLDHLREGLELMLRHHRFLDIARGRPIPHEAYYANAAYFYFFAHYYAARVVIELPEEERARYWWRLQREVLKTQESDGSMWDYPMNSHGKPYGTAFAVLCLQRSLAK